MMMLLRPKIAAQVLLVRPGSTDFDEQGRIKGSLDIPLSKSGKEQAELLAFDLVDMPLRTIYSAPCLSAQQTAKRLAKGRDIRVKVIEQLRNIDHGLWHGKLIEEVKRNQPRIYRCGEEAPDEVCPPQGESIRDAKARVFKSIRKLTRRGGDEAVAMVIPEPLATLVENYLRDEELDNLWQAETDSATWTLIDP